MMKLSVKVFVLFLLLSNIAFNLDAQSLETENKIFQKADSIADANHNHSLVNLKALSDKLTRQLDTEKEKYRAIFRWVTTNIKIDYHTYQKNRQKRIKFSNQPSKLKMWNENLRSTFFHKLINQKETVCTGYAYLIKELSFHAGIECRSINGYGKSFATNDFIKAIPNHSWNAVKIDEKWHLSDATWSSGYFDLNKQTFIPHFEDNYFLVTPELFILNHFPADTNANFTGKGISFEEFRKSPIVSKTAIKLKVIPYLPKYYFIESSIGIPISFKFSSNQSIDVKDITIKINRKIVKPIVTLDGINHYNFDFVFHKKGKYKIHIMFENEILFSYQISVSSQKKNL